MSGKYKVTNCTVKAPRIDQATKADLRSALEKRGHAVQFRDENDRPIMLQAGQSTIISRLDAGLLGLQRGGFIKIEAIENIADALKQHAYQASNHVKNAATRKAKATQMGRENYGAAADSEYEGAVNPDGEPNFIAKARRGSSTTTKKKRGVNVSASRSNKENGQSQEIS